MNKKRPVFLAGLLLVCLIAVNAQTPTPTPCPSGAEPANNAGHAWPQNVDVQVAIDTQSLNQLQVTCIQEAFDAYNNQNLGPNGNGSGVKFFVTTGGPTLAYATPSVPSVTRMQDAQNIQYVYQVRGVSTNHSSGQGDTFMGDLGISGRLDTAVTRMRDSMTDCDAIKETMGHEIAHTLGLDHCPTTGSVGSETDNCLTAPNSSVMALPDCAARGQTCPADTKVGSPQIPTDCDKYVLKYYMGYDPSTARNPDSGGGGGTGGGQTCVTYCSSYCNYYCNEYNIYEQCINQGYYCSPGTCDTDCY